MRPAQKPFEAIPPGTQLKVYVPNGPVLKRRSADQPGVDGAFAAAFLSEASFNSRDSFSTR